ncbi:hypothetical protein CAPTEDRAFT_170715 [Capitella teleta]|uniref:EF-hand domain-containing protein n=1 Tax=Capitella teleta TaxID=283909 RepID=R7UGH7_CAPTE|nr:hypothetical protein CAPTEDRAFT_170715 [Capitella teleta]|eukprot:ELU05330.1 hypothetical protein CAPTEDRAFT_170715 [Capitella teleta]
MDNQPEVELEGGAESPQEQNEPENAPDKSEEDIERDRDKTWMRLYNFTEDQLTELKEVFAMCDREDNGMICAPDVGTALRAMGQNPTEAELVEMLQEANLDDAGQMSLDEFMRLVGHKGLKTDFEMEEEFEEALKVFDHENVGLIEASDLKT